MLVLAMVAVAPPLGMRFDDCATVRSQWICIIATAVCRNRAIHYRIAERGIVAERIARTAAWQLAFHVMLAGVLWAGGGTLLSSGHL